MTTGGSLTCSLDDSNDFKVRRSQVRFAADDFGPQAEGVEASVSRQPGTARSLHVCLMVASSREVLLRQGGPIWTEFYDRGD